MTRYEISHRKNIFGIKIIELWSWQNHNILLSLTYNQRRNYRAITKFQRLKNNREIHHKRTFMACFNFSRAHCMVVRCHIDKNHERIKLKVATWMLVFKVPIRSLDTIVLMKQNLDILQVQIDETLVTKDMDDRHEMLCAPGRGVTYTQLMMWICVSLVRFLISAWCISRMCGWVWSPVCCRGNRLTPVLTWTCGSTIKKVKRIKYRSWRLCVQIKERLFRILVEMLYKAFDEYRMWWVPQDVIQFARQLWMAMSPYLGSIGNFDEALEMLEVVEETPFELLKI